ncbi:hypothetical protein [Pseudomonas parafulva]|uniref:Uncharacterized protein n=1 Tax=Pseudomonas parafulva TaxID=157782 RepID=A0AAJ0PFX4_9PSED|nr:hypothetical protein [Pseudomonas parafulva]KTS98317.1 hypothetical protein NS212_08770 [Pseudomonas parafulva]KTT19089.1 hypothetical protein NS96R_05905 [Pseudomonas parafulva]
MFNMVTMAAEEYRADAEERTYYRWIDKASDLLGHQVTLGSQEESDLHDLYADDCTPAEAVTELLAQAELARAA